MEDLIEKLKDIGLSGNEAKVYVALVKKYPLTGYEISKLANIQQARAYDALKSLETKQIVLPSSTKPISYTPIKPKEFNCMPSSSPVILIFLIDISNKGTLTFLESISPINLPAFVFKSVTYFKSQFKVP